MNSYMSPIILYVLILYTPLADFFRAKCYIYFLVGYVGFVIIISYVFLLTNARIEKLELNLFFCIKFD